MNQVSLACRKETFVMRLLFVILFVFIFTVGIVDQANSKATEEAMMEHGNNAQVNTTAIEPLKGADVSPLADDVFIRFQEMKLIGRGCTSNYRFLLYNDGRFFLQENSAENCSDLSEGSNRFNEPFADKPTKILGTRELEAIRKSLVEHGYDKLPSHIAPEGKAFDGSMMIMEVRTGTGIKRVICIQGASKQLDNVLNEIWNQVY